MPTRQKKKQKQKQKQQRKHKQAQKQHRQDMAKGRHQVDKDGLLRILPPTTRLTSTWTTITASYIIKDAFRLHTLLTIGAIVQIALCMGFQQPWCYLPAMTLLGYSLGTTALRTIAPLLPTVSPSNIFIQGAVFGRSTAIVGRVRGKEKNDGNNDGKEDAERGGGVVVFHFGARFNHPLGLLAPGGRDMTMLYRATVDALEDDRLKGGINFGLLGANLFRGGERASNDTIFLVLYFRDIDGLQRFARGPVHEQAYRWLEGHRCRYPHLSAFHETFRVPDGCFESLYINTAPILLGNTFVREGEEFESRDEWVNSLVDAGNVRLQTMKARMRYQTTC